MIRADWPEGTRAAVTGKAVGSRFPVRPCRRWSRVGSRLHRLADTVVVQGLGGFSGPEREC